MSNDEDGEPSQVEVITASLGEVIQIDDLLTEKLGRRKSHEGHRRPAVIIKEQKGGKELKGDSELTPSDRQRMIDQREHVIPQKLLKTPPKSAGSQSRKSSFLSFLPGRQNQEKKVRKGSSPRLMPRGQMPIIQQSDTDTDTESKPRIDVFHSGKNIFVLPHFDLNFESVLSGSQLSCRVFHRTWSETNPIHRRIMTNIRSHAPTP